MKSHEILYEYFLSHREEIITDFSRIVAVPSVLSAPVDGAPNGINSKKALEEVVKMFRENGFDIEISRDNLYAIAKYGEGEKSIGIFSHGDVVPVDDKWIKTQPFSPIVDKNRLFGRGTSDDKNALVFALWFLRGLRDCNIKMKNALSAYFSSALTVRGDSIAIK